MEKYLKKVRPNTIHFELTGRCNLRCVHCLFAQEEQYELSVTEIFDILLQIKNIGVMHLALSGGEIFLRKDIEEILSFLLDHRFLLTIYTNGTLLSESLVKMIKNLNPLSVELSVYGASADVHDTITTIPGSFKKTMNSINALRSSGVSTTFKGFLLKENFHQRWQMINLATDMKVRYAFDFNLVPMVNGNTSNLSVGLTIQQLKEIYKEVLEDDLILRNNFEVKSRDSQLPEGGRVICHAGLINGCIGSDGSVYPCPILRLPIGNLRESSFDKIWQTKKIDALRYMELKDLETCFTCSLLKYCNRCPGAVYLETGNYLGPAPSICDKYKALVSSEGRR